MMFDDTLTHPTRPCTNGVTPAVPVPTAGDDGPVIVPDPAFDRQRQVDQLNQQLTDHRFAMEAIGLALATIERYDPAVHHLNGRLATYHSLFKSVAPVAYTRCPNVKLAAQALDILIAERAVS